MTATAQQTIEPENNQENMVVTYSVTLADIAKLAEEYKDIPEDLSIKKNYELVKSRAAKLRKFRTAVEARRKELKADALAWSRRVDSTAKELTEKILEIEEPIATAKKDYDTKLEIEKREATLAEERRVDGIAERIAGIKALVEANISSTSDAIQEAINRAQSNIDEINDWAMEFADKALVTIEETIAKLTELHSLKLQQEKAEEIARIAEEERARKEAEEQARREAEMKAEQERLAEERKKIEAERVEMERQRMAAEEQARIQREAAEKEASRLQAEIDALKAKALDEQRVQKESTSQAVTEEAPPQVNADNRQEDAPNQTKAAAAQSAPGGYSDDYRAAGNAILKFVGSKQVVKVLLDAIIAREIPNVVFTGK